MRHIFLAKSSVYKSISFSFKRIYECILRLTSLTMIRKVWNRKFGKEVSYQMFVYWCQFKIYCIMDSEFLPNFDKQIYQCFFFDKLVKLVKIQGSFVCSKVLTFKPIFNFEFLFCYNSLIDIFFTYYIDLIQYCPREQDWIRLIDICDGKTRKFRWL